MLDKTENKAREKWKTIAIIFIIIALILLVFLQPLSYKNENRLLRTLLITDIKVSENLINEETANTYYDLAGLCYEKQDYKCVESNCEMARDYFSKASQGYHNIKAEVINEDFNYKIIDVYVSMLDELSNQNYNMFEACEYFEGASRYYDIYYNGGDNTSYDMGNGEIESMGKKIKAHDESVIRYNNLLAEYKIEIEKLVE